MISETKIDENFLIEGFNTSYRLDRDSKCGGIMLFVIADIPSNLLAFEENLSRAFLLSLTCKILKY